MAGLICAGDLYFDRFDENGNSTGFVDVGSVSKFEVQATSENKQLPSKQRAKYGQTIASVDVPGASSLAVLFDEINRDTISLATLGLVTSGDANSGTASNEEIVAHSGRRTQVQSRDISSVVVTNQSGDTTYAVNDDYTVEPASGMIYFVPGGAVADGSTVKVSYSYAAQTGAKVSGGASPAVRGALYLEGINLQNQKPIRVRVPETTLTPDAGVDLMADDFAKVSMSGVPVIKTGETAPYQIELGE